MNNNDNTIYINDEELPELESCPDEDCDVECNYIDCGDCPYLRDAYFLIDYLVDDIKALEEEVVRWRQALLKHLKPLDARDLSCDIFDGLAERRAGNNDAYDAYMKMFRYKEDPMESKDHVELLWRLRNGTDETSVHL